MGAKPMISEKSMGSIMARMPMAAWAIMAKLGKQS